MSSHSAAHGATHAIALPMTVASNVGSVRRRCVFYILFTIALVVMWALWHRTPGAAVFLIFALFYLYKSIRFFFRSWKSGTIAILGTDGLRYLEGAYAELPVIPWRAITGITEGHTEDPAWELNFIKPPCLEILVDDVEPFLAEVASRATRKKLRRTQEHYGDQTILRIDFRQIKGSADAFSDLLKQVMAQQKFSSLRARA